MSARKEGHSHRVRKGRHTRGGVQAVLGRPLTSATPDAKHKPCQRPHDREADVQTLLGAMTTL